MKEVDFWVNFFANLLTIVASGLAIYLFYKNKDKLVSVLNAITNYAVQLTLSDLKYKVERLNDYTAADKEQLYEIINLLNDIEGQIIGNKALATSSVLDTEENSQCWTRKKTKRIGTLSGLRI